MRIRTGRKENYKCTCEYSLKDKIIDDDVLILLVSFYKTKEFQVHCVCIFV